MLSTTVNEWNFDLANFEKYILNTIKVEKRLIRKEIVDNIKDQKKLCIIKILARETYNKTLSKLTSSSNIKGLYNIICDDNTNDDDDDDDNDDDDKEIYFDNTNSNNDNDENDKYEILKCFNFLHFPQKNITIINILLDYDLIRKIAQSNNSLNPNCNLDYKILDIIMKNENIIFFLDSCLFKECQESEECPEMAYIITYMSYYLSGMIYPSIKFKCRNIELLKDSFKSVKSYFSSILLNSTDDGNINEKYKQKKLKDKYIKESLGGINLYNILKKNDIKNLSKSKMNNTTKFFNKYLEDYYNDDDNDNNDIYITKIRDIIEIFKHINKPDNDNIITPPTSINLENLNSITIKMKNDSQDIYFIFKGDSDSSQRVISSKFFEMADDIFIINILEDLFFHNIDKIEKKDHLYIILQNKKQLDNEYQKLVFTKIFDNIKSILVNFYEVKTPEIIKKDDDKIYFKFNRKVNITTNKRKINTEEEEEEEEEKVIAHHNTNNKYNDDNDDDDNETIFKLGKTVAEETLLEKKNIKSKSSPPKKNKIKHD